MALPMGSYAQIVSAVAACVGILVTIITWAVTYGKLTERIAVNTQRIEKIDVQVVDHEGRIITLEEWRRGVRDGMLLATNPHK